MATDKIARRLRIRRGIRKKIGGTAEKPRLSVFKSNRAIYAQLIDDVNGHTIAQASSKEFGEASSINMDTCKKVGKSLADRASSNGIDNVTFDRSGYQYHGKVKALAEGAREGGLKF
ncbi:MAG: 50S ribosomal protein L18 [Cyclobacteriaceae bacterium]